MKPFFVYNTSGDWVATRAGEHLWDPTGQWVGWVEGNDVYKRDGEWIGELSRDGRILRKRTAVHRPLRTDIPSPPNKPDDLPGRAPPPPLISELTFSIVDVTEEDPELFKRISDLRPDME